MVEEPEPVASLAEEPEPDTEPDTERAAEETVPEPRESLYAVTAPSEAGPSEPADEPRAQDDLEDASADPRPLGWLFRGH